MISKISFSNIRKENMKHRMGMIFLVALGFLAYFIGFLMSMQDILFSGNGMAENIKNITGLARPESVLGIVSVFSAVFLSVSGFRFMHSRKETDFYQALPIRRRDLFKIILQNDVFIFLLALMTVMVLRCLAVSFVGCLSPEFFTWSLTAVLCYVLVFESTYLLMTLAMLMTGNTFVAMLGFGVFAGYFPVLIRMLFPGMARIFFYTYCEEPGMLRLLCYLSPPWLSQCLLSAAEKWEWSSKGGYFISLCVWILVLFVLDLFLVQKRASEAAGKSMAFEKTKPVIRVLLVIPLTLYGGIFLYSFSFSSFKPWFVVGMLISGVLVHGLIECIYRFDVRGLLAYKKQMFACMAVSFAIAAFFWMDISGYDQYVPDENETGAVFLEEPGMSSFFWGEKRSGISGEDMDKVLMVLEKEVLENKENYLRSNVPQGTEHFNDYIVEYRLKNGQTKKRSYLFSKRREDELLAQLYKTENYRKDTFSLYTADWSRVKEVSVNFPAETENLNMTEKQREKLFRYYLEEFSGMSYEDLKKERPFGQLTITYRKSQEEYTDVYYLYPSFQKTIGYLRDELGAEIALTVENINISSLEIYDYNEDEGEIRYCVTDEEIIQKTKEHLAYVDSVSYPGVYSLDDNVITATVIKGDEEEELNFYADPETVQIIKNEKYRK